MDTNTSSRLGSGVPCAKFAKMTDSKRMDSKDAGAAESPESSAGLGLTDFCKVVSFLTLEAILATCSIYRKIWHLFTWHYVISASNHVESRISSCLL